MTASSAKLGGRESLCDEALDRPSAEAVTCPQSVVCVGGDEFVDRPAKRIPTIAAPASAEGDA